MVSTSGSGAPAARRREDGEHAISLDWQGSGDASGVRGLACGDCKAIAKSAAGGGAARQIASGNSRAGARTQQERGSEQQTERAACKDAARRPGRHRVSKVLESRSAHLPEEPIGSAGPCPAISVWPPAWKPLIRNPLTDDARHPAAIAAAAPAI